MPRNESAGSGSPLSVSKNFRSCHTCGGPISLDDLEKRRAVIVLKRSYCGACSDRIVASGTSATGRRLYLSSLFLSSRPRLLAAVAIAVALAAVLLLTLGRGLIPAQ